MSSLFSNLPKRYYPAVVILFFEACYILYWFISAMYLVFAIETDAGEKYRAFQGTLGVHLLIAPAGIFYVLESHKKKPYMFLVWIFFGIFVFDFYAVLETFIHLKRTIFDFWQVIAASSTWPFILSTSTLAWYIYILCTEPKIKFRA